MKATCRKVWTANEDRLLKKYIKEFGPKWLLIAKAIGHNRNASQCSQRWKRIREHVPKQTRWSADEDQLLLKLKYKNMNWTDIKSYFPERTGAQVKKRFENVLDPTINREPFSLQEDTFLWELVQKHGTKWTEISKLFKGRPENMIKNRYYFHIRQKVNHKQHPYYEKQSTIKPSIHQAGIQPNSDSIQEVDCQLFSSQSEFDDNRLTDYQTQIEEIDEYSDQYSCCNPLDHFSKRTSPSPLE